MGHQLSSEFCACRCRWGIDGVGQEPLGPWWCKRSESEPERLASGVLSPSPERTRCTSIAHNFDRISFVYSRGRKQRGHELRPIARVRDEHLGRERRRATIDDALRRDRVYLSVVRVGESPLTVLQPRRQVANPLQS